MENASVDSDEFLDALEELSSESDSTSDSSDNQGCSSEVNQVNNNELNCQHYDFWRRNPKSIEERRDDFTRKTGFVLDRCQTAREGPADDACMNAKKCNVRTGAGVNEHDDGKELAAGVSREAVNEGAQKLWWRIQCLDDGKEFDVDSEGIMTRDVNEGSAANSKVTINDFQDKLGSTTLAQLFMQSESVLQDDVVCKKKLQCKEGWLKRFGLKAANMFNRDKEHKEMLQKFEYLGYNTQRVRVHSHKKWSKELSSLYQKQEFSAHKGSILAMKFSIDGQYLATGGEDGTLNVWKVIEDEILTDFNLLSFSPASANLNFSINGVPNPACFLKFKEGRKVKKKLKKSLNSDGIMIPHKGFHILEKPLHKFDGHEGEILDISWSKNGHLLSSSVDKTVRLWRVGCSECLRVFPHNDFVTCAQFNPMDDSYFISGSIDGIVRVWDSQTVQVVDWIDIKEIVTAICYRPDGKGGIVGSMVGNCSFFEIADDFLHRVSIIYLQDKKTLTCKRITGFQFSPNNPSEVVVSSADSLVRILKGADIICKLRGSLPLIDRGSQVFASFTADGKHVISATEDSNVYVWNRLNNIKCTNNKPKNIWSCESFLSQNAVIAVPWHGITSNPSPTSTSTSTSTPRPSKTRQPSTSTYSQESPVSSDNYSVNYTERQNRRAYSENEAWPWSNQIIASPDIGDTEFEYLRDVCEGVLSGSHMWGLVIVTAGKDGWIRTYHNYGLPARFPHKRFSFTNIRNHCGENCSSFKGSTSLG